MGKKLLFLITLCLIITLTGCTNNEKNIVNPNGTSKTYKFFKEQKYNENTYTLVLKNKDQVMTIIKQKNDFYYQIKDKNNTVINIEKNGNRYLLNKKNKTYTKEPITSYEDYAKGYIPKNPETIKNKSYKTGTKWEGLNRYIYEKYVYDEGETIYYFKGNKLKKISNKTPLTQTTVNFVKLSNKIDKSKFNLPKSYQEITY